MKNEDYKTEFEEHRQEISLSEEKNSDVLPSRTELHRKGSKPKKKPNNLMINSILVLFTLIPLGILIYYFGDFKSLNNASSNNHVSAGYEMNENISSGQATEPDKNLVLDDPEEDEKEEDTGIPDAKTPIDPPQTNDEEEEIVTTEQPPENKTEEEPIEETAVKTHIVAANETLYRISINYYQSDKGVEKIKKANGLTSNNIMVGQKLIIPD